MERAAVAAPVERVFPPSRPHATYTSFGGDSVVVTCASAPADAVGMK